MKIANLTFMKKLSDSDLKKAILFLAKTSKNPLKFVKNIFPWGKGELKSFQKPLKWQEEVLKQIRDGSLNINQAVKVAIASGHGVGKSALVAWITLWAISTKPSTKGVITANTENQLKTKTWAEVAKWYRLSFLPALFNITSTSLFSIDKMYEKSWRVDIIPWSENNTEAFAGLHNQGGRIFLIFDEASSIPDPIWDVAEGALTDKNTEIYWLAFGNPTRSYGRFKECFYKFRHRWNIKHIDSRSVDITNKEQINKWIEDYGINSDFIKIRVLGEFPSKSHNQLIGTGIINNSINRDIKLNDVTFEPKVIGVDVARFGDDSSVIALRQGRLLINIKSYQKVDTMRFADIVASEIDSFQPDGVFIDQTGIGAGVVDRLRQMKYSIIGIDFGSNANDKIRFFNKRAEIWYLMAEWIKNCGKLINDYNLINDLQAPNYSFSGDKGQIILEKKSEIKQRGLTSPDTADALALTFSYPVGKRSIYESLQFNKNNNMNDLTKLKF